MGHRESCFDLWYQVFCLCFPLKSFIVSGLTFRSLIHFESIFVYGVKKCSISFFYVELSSFPSTTYWRGCLCPIVYSCLLSCSMVYISVFVKHRFLCYRNKQTFLIGKNVLIVMLPILIHKDVFESSYDLKFMVWNCSYVCSNLILCLFLQVILDQEFK